jgi:hypothetical protein
VTDVPDWTQSVNIQNAEIPVAGGVTIEAGQSGVGVFVGSLEYPQQVNSSFRLSATVSVYTETVPLFTLTTSIGVVIYPAIPHNFAVGTTVTVSVVGGITGVVYADEVQLQYGEGAQVTVAISGALEVTAVVTVTYSTPSLNGGVPCFFIGTFGPPGPLVAPNLPAPPTSGWINLTSYGIQTARINALSGGVSTLTLIAGVSAKAITIFNLDISVVPYGIGTGYGDVLLEDTGAVVFVADLLYNVASDQPSILSKAFPGGLLLPSGNGLQVAFSNNAQLRGTVQFTQA